MASVIMGLGVDLARAGKLGLIKQGWAYGIGGLACPCKCYVSLWLTDNGWLHRLASGGDVMASTMSR